MAGILAMRDGLKECKPVLLEPIDKVVVACPSDATARVNAIVSGRRGRSLDLMPVRTGMAGMRWKP